MNPQPSQNPGNEAHSPAQRLAERITDRYELMTATGAHTDTITIEGAITLKPARNGWLVTVDRSVEWLLPLYLDYHGEILSVSEVAGLASNAAKLMESC